MHEGHRLIKISDIESIKKENLTIEQEHQSLNNNSQNIIELKNKIENEINIINDLYKKAIDDLEKSYMKKQEKILNEKNKLKKVLENKINELEISYLKQQEELLNEENTIRENLEIEVTKTKEQLEESLSQTNNEIRIIERLNRGIKKIQNDKIYNMFKNLSYISKINKSKKSMIKLLKKKMKNIKFCYQEEKSNFKIEEYYFNGLGKPINIQIKDISCDCFNVSWNYDINVDNPKLINIVEIRMENNNFKEVYKGSNNSCIINQLEPNKIYELRISSKYNNIKGEWSEIQSAQTIKDENIFKGLPEEKKNILKNWIGFKSLQLIFKGTRDGLNFHNKCDNQGKTITFIRNGKGNIFGGYASVSFKKEGGYEYAPDSFLFSITNIFNTNPLKFKCKEGRNALVFGFNGPIFGKGNDLGIYHDYISKGGWTNFPETYDDTLGKGRSIFTGEFNNKKSNFTIKEIEVYKIID
jgi:hypothetical protein